MRVSQNQFIGSLVDKINEQQQKYLSTQERLSTTKKLNHLYDDPIGAERISLLTTIDTNYEQFIENVERTTGFMQQSEEAIKSSMDLIAQMRELATQMANDTYNAEDRTTASGQVTIVLDQLVKLANTDYDGLYVFAGTQDRIPPFDTTTFQYNGNDTVKNVEIHDDLMIDVNIPGSDVFTDTNNGTVDIFQSLIDFRTALQNNDTAAIATSLTTLQNSFEQLSQNRSIIGFNVQKLEITTQIITEKNEINTETRVNIEDADMTKETTNLAKIQQTLEANYALTGRTQNLSLLKYL